MFRFKVKEYKITTEKKKEYAKLLEMWDYNWENMTNDEVRRFMKLEKIIENEKNNKG